MERHLAEKYFPEYQKVYEAARGSKPRKFVENIQIRTCPATFNPSAQGDFAFTHSFVWDGKTLTKGPGYSYDSMLAERVDPYERQVDVPRGTRLWVVTYDGQWGGHWSRVLVFVHPDELPAPFRQLPAPKAVPEVPATPGAVGGVNTTTSRADAIEKLNAKVGKMQTTAFMKAVFQKFAASNIVHYRTLKPQVLVREGESNVLYDFSYDRKQLIKVAEYPISTAEKVTPESAAEVPKPPVEVPAVGVEAPPMTPVEYDLRYTLDELRDKARQAGVSASGSKKEIAAQLIARGIK